MVTLASNVEVTVADIYSVFRQAWLVITALVLVGGLAGFLVASTTKPVYRAKILIAANNVDNSRSSLSRIAGQLAPLANLVGAGVDGGIGGTGKDIWIAMLKSRRMTEEFINDRNLLPILLGAVWSESEKEWKTKDGSKFAPSMEKAVRLFDISVRSVVEDKKTGVITLSVEWPDRQLAADWANDLVARANDFIRTKTIEESDQSIAYLEAEIQKTSIVELRQSMYSMIESKISAAMMARVRKEYAFVVIDPAVPSEPNYFVWPRKRLMTAIGMLLGFGIGTLYAIGKRVYLRKKV